jgi:hypothetical protein
MRQVWKSLNKTGENAFSVTVLAVVTAAFLGLLVFAVAQ